MLKVLIASISVASASAFKVGPSKPALHNALQLRGGGVDLGDIAKYVGYDTS